LFFSIFLSIFTLQKEKLIDHEEVLDFILAGLYRDDCPWQRLQRKVSQWKADGKGTCSFYIDMGD
jgi:hypothetical protein